MLKEKNFIENDCGKLVFPLNILPFCNFLDNFLFDFFPLQKEQEELYYIGSLDRIEEGINRFNIKSHLVLRCAGGMNNLREAFNFLINHEKEIAALHEYLKEKVKYFTERARSHNNYLKSLSFHHNDFYKNIINYSNKYGESMGEKEQNDLNKHDDNLRNYDEFFKNKSSKNLENYDEFFKNKFSENYLLAIIMQLDIKDLTCVPIDHQVCLQVRFHGIYHPLLTVNREVYEGMINRWKMQGKLDLLDCHTPQSAFCGFYYGLKECNIRISFHPLINGQKTSIRILNTEYTNLQCLNLHPEIFSLLNIIMLQRKILFIAGLAGTGKSTLAYGIVQALTHLGWHMISIEDPVEYAIPSINQSQANNIPQYQLLKSVLRHDIDGIFIGEMRDAQTAEIVLEAISTGHSLIATLHIGTFSQLKNRWRSLTNSITWEEQIDFLLFPKIYYQINLQGKTYSTMLVEIYNSSGNIIGPTINEQIIYAEKINKL